MENPVKAIVERIDLTVNPEGLAQNYRETFSLSKEKQTKFKNSYEFFNYLRSFLEDLNILVLQLSMPVEDARGFVLMDENPIVIVVNTKDTIEARLFSLMHEFAHILLGESVIDLPDVTHSNRNNVEAWCNTFAAAFLLPSHISKEIFEINQRSLTDTGTLNKLSARYKVSKAVLLVSMLKEGYIPKSKYEEIIERYKPLQLPIKRVKGKKSGSVPSDKKCLAEVGNKFVSLVAHNFDRDFITYSDALNYLSIKSKSFEKVLSRAKK
jgi:Zn-dependent peptidase ImmA (M78 family)